MSILGKLFGAVVDTVLLPASVVADVVMLPADALDLSKPAAFSRTARRIRRIGDEIEGAADEAAE